MPEPTPRDAEPLPDIVTLTLDLDEFREAFEVVGYGFCHECGGVPLGLAAEIARAATEIGLEEEA